MSLDDLSDEGIWVDERTPESLLLDGLRREVLEAALLDLPSRMRRIVVMYFGLYEAPSKSLEAISELVGCSEEWVRQLLHVALLELRRRLEAE